MVRSLTNAVVTTDNLDLARSYYVDALKLIPVAEFVLDPVKTRLLWGLDKEYAARSLLLKRRLSDTRGYLRLVEIEGGNGVDIRENARSWDYGVFDIAFAVRDNEAKVKAIQDRGFEVFAWPVRYDFVYYDDRAPYYVTEAVVGAPNQVKVVFIERFNAPHPYGTLDEKTGFAEMIHSAQLVDDMDTATRFYHELLGIPFRGQFKNMVGPQFAEILGVPATEPFDQNLMADPALDSGSVELLCFRAFKGRQIAAQRSPLNYGVSVLSFAAQDVGQVYTRMVEAGVEIVSKPIDVELEGVGLTTAFTCYAPSDILCEVFQAK